MVQVENKGVTDDYVYDISLDGTVVNALGMNVASNTDGFDLAMPKEFRYTEEHPYIGKGLSRNVKKGVPYVGPYGDIAEFEEMYFTHAYNGGVLKMGIDCEEIIKVNINFARKNYYCLYPNGKDKKVGNTIKSRKMSGYLQKFIDKGLKLLVEDKGGEFIKSYYDYIDDIYNYRIPIKDIASKGNIKKSLEDYKKDTQTLTKAGSKKSRQAWYELAIKANLNVNMGDSISYINTGEKKSDSDVKRITHQYVMYNGKETELNAKITRYLLQSECDKENILYKNLKTKEKKERLKKYITREDDEIILNCQLVPNEILDSEKDILCSESEELGFGPIEYNVEKYIDQFNKRITPLLVCFSKDIRDKILITNPKDRKYFTEEEARLVAGEPVNEADQDTYDGLMTPEDKEISYWLKVGKTPPFIDDIGQDWDKLVNDYKERKKDEENALFKEEDKKYIDALNNVTDAELVQFENDGTIPQSLAKIVTVGSDMHFYFKAIPDKCPSTGGYIFDDLSTEMLKGTL